MRALLAVVACLGGVVGCEKSTTKRSTDDPAPRAGSAAPKPVTDDVWSGSSSSDLAKVRAEVSAAMDEFLTHAESVFAIIREHGKDCDRAAKELAMRVPVFQALGPRMMRVKEQLKTLSESDQHEIMLHGDKAMDAFKARYPDVDALDQTAKACEKTSAAFAEVAPKVMTRRK